MTAQQFKVLQDEKNIKQEACFASLFKTGFKDLKRKLFLSVIVRPSALHIRSVSRPYLQFTIHNKYPDSSSV